MKPRAQLDAELDRLAAMMPHWLRHLRHEAQFWPQFNALAKEILDQAADEDIPYVQGRLDLMLKTHVFGLPGAAINTDADPAGRQPL
ncbi:MULTISPECIES: hypothetical protein [unclassified Pseudoxanthomonas]|uniref:hypothetical protein n=1 Tax=unclassified Pseudoxanthomonas TaxID=2645906 RepID=UPI0008ED2975|nr:MULTISPECIES: hypothetical protein [unclassified Pseudoxanthomonas]SFV30662.1 hypothetical protein SAMN05428990_1741 [Pseudoxanthomonas sp. YR558]